MGKELLGIEPLDASPSGGAGHGREVPDRRLGRQLRQ
jgi:hypothetical protein